MTSTSDTIPGDLPAESSAPAPVVKNPTGTSGPGLPRTVLSAGFLAILLLAVLARGAVSPFAFAAVAMAFGLLVGLGIMVFGVPRQTAVLFYGAALIAAVLVVCGLVQTIPLGWVGNSAWSELGRFVSARPATISVEVADSRIALLALALPFFVFLGALSIFSGDEMAERVVAFVGWSGGALALWSLVTFLLFPDTLLFSEKRYYLDSLTGAFVNRNTAGTYFGLVSLTLFTRLVLLSKNVDWRNVAGRLAGRWHHHRSPFPTKVLFHAVLLLLSLIALFLTKSRAGIGSTFAAFLLLVPLLLLGTGERRHSTPFRDNGHSSLWRFARALAGLLAVLLIGLVFADRALFRAEVQGLDDARFCVAPSIFTAARDNSLVGTGFGTFRWFFPAYRDAQCGIVGIWDRAHSVYLEGYLGLGVVFWIALAIGVLFLLATFVRGLRERRRKRGYAALGLAGLVLVLAHSAVDFSLQIPGFAAVFAAVMAATATISRGQVDEVRRRRVKKRRHSLQFE